MVTAHKVYHFSVKLQQDFGPDKFIPDKELAALMKVLPSIKVGCLLRLTFSNQTLVFLTRMKSGCLCNDQR